MKRFFGIAFCLVVLVLVPACGDSGDETTVNNNSSTAVPGPTLVALSANGDFLFTFQAGAPETITSTTAIHGLVNAFSETLVGIAFRPATGQLYGLSVDGAGVGRLYTIDRSTGAAALVGSISTPVLDPNARYGIRFNPVVDRLRVVNSVNENLRINPDTGALAADDTNLTFSAPATGPIISAAYSNNVAGAATTTLYAIDAGAGALVLIGGIDGNPSPNGGVASAVGFTLGLGALGGSNAGLDITPSGAAYLMVNSAVFLVNLATGHSVRLGTAGNDPFLALRSLAIAP